MQLRRPTAASRIGGHDRREGHRAAAKLAYVETYGCQMNVADTEMVLGLLQRGGYGRTEDPTRADLILINTCAVREKAEERVFARTSILAAAARPDVVLGVTGCMAEHLKDRIRERAPEVDLVVGPDGYRRLLDHVATARDGRAVTDTRLDRDETYEGLDPAVTAEGEPDGVVGRVTIQRGCDKFCTFCVVPYTRGRERGVAPREILRQTRALVAPAARRFSSSARRSTRIATRRSASRSSCARSPPSRGSRGSASPRLTRSTSPTR